MDSWVRRLLLMLSWEKTFPSLCEQQGNSSSTLWGFLTSPTQWIISPLTQLLIYNCSHQKQKEKILPSLRLTWCQLRPLATKASLTPHGLSEGRGISKQTGSTSAAGRRITPSFAPACWRFA